MKRLNTFLATLFVSLLFVLPVSAAPDVTPESGTYQNVMACAIANYVIATQPNDAIPLNTETVVDSSNLGHSQSGIYYNLPRLKNGYYYQLEQETPRWRLAESMYPAIYLPAGVTSPANCQFKMQVISIQSNKIVASCKFVVIDQLTGADFSISVPDVSTLADDTVVSLNVDTTYYNPALHTCAFVCPKAMYLWADPSAEDMWLNATLKFSTTQTCKYDTIAAGTIDLNQYDKKDAIMESPFYTTSVGTDRNSLRIRPYCLSSEGGLAYMNTDKYNPVTGELLSGAATSTAYVLASDNELVVGTETADDYAIDDGDPVALVTNKYYTYADATKGYLTVLPDTNFKYFENQCKYYFYSNEGLDNGTFLSPAFRVVSPPFKWNGSGFATTPNPPKDETTTYSLRYTYTTGLRSTTVVVDPTVEPVLGTPTRKGYKFIGWYVDEATTTPYDFRTFSYVAGATYNLYPKWELTGNYQVRFYDDKNGTDVTNTYSIDELPVLPGNPTYTGYKFKNWMVVNTVTSGTGTEYTGTNFIPEANKTYIFKANWDVAGIILNVTTTKNEYWVGEEIDKTKLSVLVQTDNSGSTKTLAVNEFSISPSTIDKTGDNVVTITYLATGATDTVHIKGANDFITGITASYTGDSLYVGDVIPTSKITVRITYKSTKTVDTNDFSISPASIRSPGSNTVTVTASGYSTSVTIQGLKKDTQNTTTSNKTTQNGTARLTGLSASYTGSQLFVGDNIPQGSLRVTAKYSDGSTQQLNSGDFNFSPSYVKNAGNNAIDISYRDKTTKVNINALAKSDMINSSANTTGNKGGTVPGATNNNGMVHGNPGTGVTGTGAGTTGSTGNGKDKGVSPGYLDGKNVLNPNGGGEAVGNTVNEVNIMGEIEAAGADATSVNITLVNTAEGNFLTPDMIAALKGKGLVLNVSMVSPGDKMTEVGAWTFNGKALDDFESVVDLNISYKNLKKKNETMYSIVLSQAPYNSGVQFRTVMKDAFTSGTQVNMYSTQPDLTDSVKIRNFLWPSDGSIDLPITSATTFAVSSNTEVYEDGSDLNMELTDISDETGDEPTLEGPDSDIEDEEPFDWGEPTDDEPDKPEKEKKSLNLLPIAIGVIALVVLGGGAVIVTKLLRGRTPREDEDEVDDVDEDIDEELDELSDDDLYDDDLSDSE